MDIGNVLSRAWEIIWRHKALWLFGILASCTGANGSSLNSFRNERAAPQQYQHFFDQLAIPQWQIFLIVIAVIAVILLLVLLALALGTIGRIGLVRGTLRAEVGESRITFGELFNASMPYFWRVLGLEVLVGVLVFLVLFAFAIFVAIGSVLTFGILALCLIPVFCLIAPLFIFLTVIVEQSIIAIVVEDKGVLEGLQRGWQVVRDNLGVMIMMAVILYVVLGLIGGFIIGVPAALLFAPAILGGISGAANALRGGVAITLICLVFYIPIAIVLNGILQSYIGTAWTLTFLRLTGRQSEVTV
jgi:hypothetical protein